MKINIEDQTSEKTAGFRLNPNLIPILACVGYASASISMTLSNKAMFTYFRFDFPITMLIWQSIFTIALMWILEKFNVISYRELKSEVASVWLPVNILFIVMLVSGAFAIKHLSVPMITIFKNLSTVITTYGDAYVTKSTVPTGVAFSCGLIVLSSVVAASADLSFDFIGYSIMAFNCVITSAYLIYMKHVSSRNPNTKNYLDSWTMTYYNSALSLPFLIPLSFLFNEFPDSFQEMSERKWPFAVFMIWMGLAGLLMSACSLWAMKKTNPSTYGIVGSLNKIPLAILGVFFFHVTLTNVGTLSILLGLAAGMLYSWAKTRQTAQPPTAQTEPTDKPGQEKV